MKNTKQKYALILPLLFAAGCLGTAAIEQGHSMALRDADFARFDDRQVKVGQLLFYDAILSGNQNISCGTCHSQTLGTSDGLSLGIGEGGAGLGPSRRVVNGTEPEELIPRNSPALFNLGHADISVMFHDGRVQLDPRQPSGMRTPRGADMATDFSGILSAQAMFPVLSAAEMAGQHGENDVANAVSEDRVTGEGGAWDILATRVDGIAEYRALFAVFDADVAAGAPIGFSDISDAIGAFIAIEWRSDQSPYDISLRGGPALPADAQRGMGAFFGDAGCSACHSGPLLSDQEFHAMADPQLGPGKDDGHPRDVGRMMVTGRAADAYAFRTPMLRNVALTGPWGHAGGHDDLAAYVRYHANPVEGLAAYAPQVELVAWDAADAIWTVMEDGAERAAIAAAYQGTPVPLSDQEVADLVAFMETLTDAGFAQRGLGVPRSVPSGLPVDR